MSKVTSIILVLAALLSAPAMATADSDEVHLAAHLGASYAINTFMYGICSRGLHMDRVDSLIFSAMVTTFAGVAWKVMESGNGTTFDSADFKKAVFRNTLGIGLSAGTVLMFQF